MRRLLSLIALSLVTVSAWADAPAVGQQAPDFHLQDQHGNWHTLATDKGKYLVLYFYPKDFTAGCTTEVCTYTADTAKLHKAGAAVVGISLDDVKSHQEFADKYHVPFPLLSDADSTVAAQYGVLTSMTGKDGKSIKYAERETFLIDPAGKIVKVYKDVDPEKNSGQVLADIAALKKQGA